MPDRVAVLEAELAVERARREAAERLAGERLDRVEDMRLALRALGPAPTEVARASFACPAAMVATGGLAVADVGWWGTDDPRLRRVPRRPPFRHHQALVPPGLEGVPADIQGQVPALD